MAIPKQKTKDYFPGLEDQHETGLSGVGYSVVTATLMCNSVQTDAQLIAAPPNSGIGAAFGPIIHSLGTAPGAVIPLMNANPSQGLGFAINMQFVTADNSAVYLRAYSWTGTAPAGISVRVIAVR